MVKFSTTMSIVGNNTGIEVPPEIIEALGAGRKPPVTVSVNGYEYRSTVAVMGSRYMISFSADKRVETGIVGGDPITVELTLDTAVRTVELPHDLGTALSDNPAADAAYEKLSYSAKKAHVTSVLAAKAPETRARRIQNIVSKLLG